MATAPSDLRNASGQIAGSDAKPAGVFLACAWIAGYLIIFLLLPAGSEQREPRGENLLVSLLRPDDLLRSWLSGTSWQSLGERLWILLIALVVVSVAASAGWLCLRLFRVDRAVTRFEMTLLAIGVGLNVVSLFTLAMGLMAQMRPEWFIGVGLIACVAAAATRRFGGCESGTCSLPSQQVAHPSAPAWRWSPHWLWLTLPFTGAIILSAMFPPMDFDVCEYHLQAPKEFFQNGRVNFLPHNVYANMPLGAEMLALFAMVISGDWWTGALAGKVVIAGFAPLTALLLYCAGRRFASPAAGILAALIYLTIPWVAIVSAHGLIEGAFAFYLFAAIYVALIWQDNLQTASQISPTSTTHRGLLIIAGFLAGSAVSTKYPAVVYCAVPLAIYVSVFSWRGQTLKTIVQAILFFILGLVVGCGLWFAKNALFTGNPTYPLLYDWFDGATRTAVKDAQWQAAHRPPNYQPVDFAKHAWNLLLAGAWISPLVTPLAILAYFTTGTRRLVYVLAEGTIFIFASWWLLTHRIDRFLVPLWPLAALLAGIGATWCTATAWRRVLAIFLITGCAYSFVMIAGGAIADNRYFMPLGELRRETTNLDPWHTYLNDHQEQVRRVLLVGDAQPFDLDVPALYNTVFDDSTFEAIARDKSPEQVRQSLQDRGISHVYVHWPEIARYRAPGNYGITDYLQPQVFEQLVAAGVLEPLPMLADHGGRMYRVIAH